MTVPKRVVVMLFVPMVSGCFFPGGHCGLSPDGATWQDPTLYDAMPAPGTIPGHEASWNPPAAGLPFNYTVDASWGPHNLTQVTRGGGDRLDGWRIWLEAHGLHADRLNQTPEALLVAELERFLGLTTALAPAEVSQYISTLLASASNGSEYAFYRGGGGNLVPVHPVVYSWALPGELRLNELWAALDASGAISVDRESARAGPWAFAFSTATRTLGPDDGSYVLTVKPSGEAEFEGLRVGEQKEGTYEGEVRRILQARGLPEPVDEMDVSGSIC